jgi:hypothetical protein
LSIADCRLPITGVVYSGFTPRRWKSRCLRRKHSSKKEFFFFGTNLQGCVESKGDSGFGFRNKLPLAAKYSDRRFALLYPRLGASDLVSSAKQRHEVRTEEPGYVGAKHLPRRSKTKGLSSILGPNANPTWCRQPRARGRLSVRQSACHALFLGSQGQTFGPVPEWARKVNRSPMRRAKPSEPIVVKVFFINEIPRKSAKRTQAAYHSCCQILSVILGPFFKKKVWLGRTIKDSGEKTAEFIEWHRYDHHHEETGARSQPARPKIESSRGCPCTA